VELAASRERMTKEKMELMVREKMGPMTKKRITTAKDTREKSYSF